MEKESTELRLVAVLPKDARMKIPNEQLRSLMQKCSVKELSQRFGVDENTVYSYLNGITSPRLSLLLQIATEGEIEDLFSSSPVKFGDGGNSASAILPTRLNPKIAYLVGALRDGTLSTSGKYEVCYYQKETRWLEYLEKLLMEAFKPSNKFRLVVRERHTPKLTISNRPIFEYFRNVFEIPVGKKIGWGTPKVILRAPLDIQIQYVRGYFDADGVSGKEHTGFCQANLQSLLDIKSILKKLGIECRPKIEERKTKKGKDFYYLYIKKCHHKAFFEKVGSSNPSKAR